MSILPVRSLAGWVAVGHDLAASTLEELLALMWPRPAQPAGLPPYLCGPVAALSHLLVLGLSSRTKKERPFRGCEMSRPSFVVDGVELESAPRHVGTPAGRDIL